jgi:signal transduction histidine kinase
MQKNITRANTLVQSFKNLSVSQVVDTRENLVLPEVVDETLELFSIQARKANLDVKFTHTVPAEYQVWNGYRGHLSRILLNLLTNVERYAYPAESGGNVAVTLRFEPTPTVRYILAVRDEGAGIAPEHLPKVFEPFFTTGRAHGGAGLGLSVVYNLVTAALHGSVTAESTLGQGATFTVTFPHAIPE